MIGASLSGVTFISVPGEVGTSGFSYFQVVLGYLAGYLIIGTILLPLYYKLNLVSIYTYLQKRFGELTYKTGSFFFLLSRTIGAAVRLFLVAKVLQIAFFDAFQIRFELTVIITICLIYIYTYRAGIKTIVWTDTLQTFFMLASVVASVFIIGDKLDLSTIEIFSTISEHEYSQIFVWEWRSPNNFWKQFIAGAFIAIAMTGLDQDMMQKNLTCKNLGDAQKNMFWFSVILVPVNLLFLSLGVLLYAFSAKMGIPLPETTDKLFPYLAVNHFSMFAGVIFLLGIIAAAFSSADSALTALTTAFCIDFLKLDINKDKPNTRTAKRLTHLGFSVIVFLAIVIFNKINNQSVVWAVFKIAGYTYGPLLGMFAFGLFTNRKIADQIVPIVAFLSPVATYFANAYSEKLFDGYQFGFELLVLNGAITFMGMLAFSNNKNNVKPAHNQLIN